MYSLNSNSAQNRLQSLTANVTPCVPHSSRGHSVTTVRFRAEHDFEYPSAAELGPNHTDVELALWNADGRTKGGALYK